GKKLASEARDLGHGGPSWGNPKSVPPVEARIQISIIWSPSAVPGKLRPPSPSRAPSPQMIKVKRIDHVAVAVADRDAAAHDLSAMFGLTAGAREHVAGQKTDVAFLHAGGAGGDA